MSSVNESSALLLEVLDSGYSLSYHAFYSIGVAKRSVHGRGVWILVGVIFIGMYGLMVVLQGLDSHINLTELPCMFFIRSRSIWMSTKSIVYIDPQSNFYGTEVNILVGVAYITLFGRGVRTSITLTTYGLLYHGVIQSRSMETVP